MDDDQILPPLPTMIPGAAIDAGAEFLDAWQAQWNGEPYTHQYLAEEIIAAALGIGEVQVQIQAKDSAGSYINSRPGNAKSFDAVMGLAQRLKGSIWYRHYIVWPNGVTMQTPWEEIPYDDARL